MTPETMKRAVELQKTITELEEFHEALRQTLKDGYEMRIYSVIKTCPDPAMRGYLVLASSDDTKHFNMLADADLRAELAEVVSRRLSAMKREALAL